MKVTDILVRCLENEGVEFVFGIVGKETIDLADSLAKSNQILFVNVRHEQGAAFMADVYGRLSKKAGVCLTTLGPGATNLLTGISSAQLDHSPVVAIVGQAGIERHHQESHQYIDLVKLFEPSVKWSTQINHSETLPVILRKAFRTAKIGKPGAVTITLPENFARQNFSGIPMPVTALPGTMPDEESIKVGTALLKKHLKPFILVGNGVFRQEAVPELLDFIHFIQSPVTHSFMAKGVLAKEHPQNYFTFGFNENDLVLQGINEADLLIVIGLDFVEKLPKDWNVKKLPVIHIDTLPAEINEHYPVVLELVGNIKKTLQLLNLSGLPVKSWVPTGNLREKMKAAYHLNKKEELRTLPLSIENVLQCIEILTSDHTILISDVGAHKVSIARTYQPKEPNRLIISNGLASMGIAIPGGIGAKLACPNDPVICITGDGGALMNFAEIETAKRLGLSFIIIVINDRMLKLEVQQMNERFGKSQGVTFQNPDFVQLAASFGIKGTRAATLFEFEKVLKEALQSLNEMVLIELAM